MSGRSADGLFDTGRFVRDACRYLERHRITQRDAAALLELHHSTLGRVLVGGECPSLMLACKLAALCDLSLDSYRLELLEVAS